jgi:hypothetical protein
MTKPTTYELSERVLDEPGCLREIGVALGISKAYASMLKKARTDCAAQVIDHWRSGLLPWELVRALSRLPRSEQLGVLRPYLHVVRTEPEASKDALKESLRTIKELRGIGMPIAKAEEIYAEAEALYGDDECQIERKKIVVAENAIGEVDGYWVPAMVWVSAENISTEG